MREVCVGLFGCLMLCIAGCPAAAPTPDAGDETDAGPPPDPVQFVATAALETARISHTATLLDDGSVLVVGGETYSGAPRATLERFDETTEAWTTVGELPSGVSNHQATLLPSGKVLITGGGGTNAVGAPSGANGTADVFVYDPTTNDLAAAAAMHNARSHHTATRLLSGDVLVTGGSSDVAEPTNPTFGQALARAEIYSEATGSWREVGPLLAARFLHQAVLLPSGDVFILGGSNGTEDVIGQTEVLRAGTESFEAQATLDPARVFFQAALGADGRVFVVGGKLANIRFLEETALFDPSADALGTFAAGPALSSGRTAPVLNPLGSSRLLVTGGLALAGGFTAQTQALVLSDNGSAFAEIGPMLTPRVQHTATTLRSGRVLLVGGHDGSDALASCELGVPAP